MIVDSEQETVSKTSRQLTQMRGAARTERQTADADERSIEDRKHFPRCSASPEGVPSGVPLTGPFQVPLRQRGVLLAV